jgi:hypothetical protein
MPGIKRRKCRHCHTLFIPDHRNRDRQKYCFLPECRNASKAASQQRWLDKPENQDYFQGPDNVKRVQRWRKDNPGYWKRKSKTGPDALQDPLNQQHINNTNNNCQFANDALQDLLNMQPSVLIGIIAQLTGYALQDDIAMAARRMQQFGNDILNPQLQGGHHGNQTAHLPGPYP